MSRSKRRRTEKSSPASTAIRSGWERSARAPRTRAQDLRTGLPLASFASEPPEHRQGDCTSWSGDWPGTVCWSTACSTRRQGPGRHRAAGCRLLAGERRGSRNADVLVLSRFAYMRRRGNEMVLESPRAGALFRICDPKIATAIAMLSTPQQIKRLRRQDDFPGVELLALLVDCRILFKVDAAATAACDRPRATTTSFFGTFTIFCSTRAARKAGTPTRWAEFILMRASCLRCRRCGPAGPERRSICASFRPRMREAISAESRKAPARTSFDPQLRRPETDHARRAFAFSRRHRACSGEVEKRDRPGRTRSVGRVCRQAVSVGGRRATSSSSIWRSTNAKGSPAGFYHYDAGGHALVPIGAPCAGARSAVDGSRIRNGCARRAPNPDHDCCALRPDFMEVQLARLCAHPEGRRRVDANALPDGDRHGARRMRDRQSAISICSRR